MSSPKVSNIGKSGANVVFTVAGTTYQTGALSSATAATLTVAQAEALIASGQATTLQSSYLAQFPWTTPATK